MNDIIKLPEDDHKINGSPSFPVTINEIDSLFQGTNNIQEYNDSLDFYIKKKIAFLDKKNAAKQHIERAIYLKNELVDRLKNDVINYATILGINDLTADDILVEFIDRANFGTDMTIRMTSLIKKLGKEYNSTFLPGLVSYMKENNSDAQDVQYKGIYLNIRLSDEQLLSMLDQSIKMGEQYGESDIHAGQTMIAEYSSPNAAKHLHAGHIRSTVIGQILANIYEKTGYGVHRLNHINDRGGFGELIEGYDRWGAKLQAEGYTGNDLSFMIYSIYRKAEKAVDVIQEQGVDSVSEDDKTFLKDYFDFSDGTSLVAAFEDYKTNSTERFRSLEDAGQHEFEGWKKIFGWSLEEFNKFYKALDITHDFVIGESFYEKMGKNIVQEGMDKGIIVHFTKDIADDYYAKYLEENKDQGENVKEQKSKEIYEDVGSYVALLDKYERYVVMRSDGASIYATRDLGCLYYRCMNRDPETVMYEVGQEQTDHFNKLFETARKFGWDKMNDGNTRKFLHIYHGFYVNAKDKKKLSSREGASNVHNLIKESEKYFHEKYASKNNFEDEEISNISKTLGKASIIINDIRKARTSPVYVDSDLQKALAGFEESGGPYLMYTLCRAKSLLKRAETDKLSQNVEEDLSQENGLDNIESEIIKKIAMLSDMMIKANEEHEPSILVDYVYALTQHFNTLYSTKKYLSSSKLGVRITKGYINVMANVLKVFNIQPLERM